MWLYSCCLLQGSECKSDQIAIIKPSEKPPMFECAYLSDLIKLKRDLTSDIVISSPVELIIGTDKSLTHPLSNLID